MCTLQAQKVSLHRGHQLESSLIVVVRLKCNRGHPCDNCTKRGDNASCTYATPGSRKKNSSTHSAMTSPDDMQNRIDRLEGLVLSLMTNGSQSAGPAAAAAAIASMNTPSNPQSHQGSISGSSTTMDQSIEVDAPETIKEEQGGTAHEDSDVEQVAKSIGVMKVDNNKTIFASEAHWYAILGEVCRDQASATVILQLTMPADRRGEDLFQRAQKAVRGAIA